MSDSLSGIPRSEYPRPDFQRGTSQGIDWINLNGTWEFVFDPDDIGKQECWYLPQFEGCIDQICVPYPWESLAAWNQSDQATSANYLSTKVYLSPDDVTCGGLERGGNYRDEPRHTIGWYRRQVSIPSHWCGQRVILKFGASDWHTMVWVNGKCVGEHQNGYLPFEFDITESLVDDAPSCVVVRVFDPQDHSQQPVGKQYGWYTRTSGIWQTVYLEPRSETFIKSFKIYPDIDAAEARVDIQVGGTDLNGLSFRLDTDAPLEKVDIEMFDDHAECVIEIQKSKLQLWDMDNPHLYDLDIQLVKDDNVIDHVSTYFGMRKVSRQVLPGTDYEYIYLNNLPIYLLGALNQSFSTEGVYTFLDDDQIRADITRAKEFGFNFLRLHIKIDEPRLYYWADRLGMLFMCDIPNLGYDGYSDIGRQRWEQTLRGTIDRDFNHPSIIAWCDFNETWGLGGNDYKQMQDRQEWVREMYHLTKRLDSTRLVEDNSPCLYDHVETDINSWHFYINDYQKAREHVANVVKETYPGSKFNYTGDNEQTNAPMMNSEYGGIGAGAGDKDISWCFKYLTNELRLHQKICGYIYTELQDIEWEHNGFMNYDRTVKEFGYDYTMINALDFIVIDHHPGLSFVPGDLLEVGIHSSHFSNKKIEQATLYWRLDGIDQLGSELMNLVSGSVPISFAQYKVEKVHQLSINLPNQPVIGTLHVWVADQNQSVVARNFINVEIFKEPPLIEYPSENTTIIRLDIGDSPVVEFAGSGKLEYTVDLPDSIRLESINCFEIVFEASSYVDGAPQTDWEKHPSDLKITINGIELKTITLPSSPADARGALSYINGIPGKYGFLTKIKVDDEQLNSLRNSLSGNKLTVGYQVDPEAENSGGLTIYGARVGRYPLDPYIIIS